MCNSDAIITKESINFFNLLYDKIDTEINVFSYIDIKKLDSGEQTKCFIDGG